MKKKGCFPCWNKEDSCPIGTISGSCNNCVNFKREARVPPPIQFFSQAMSIVLLRLATSAKYLALNPDGLYYNVLEIQTKTENRNGVSQPCSLPISDQFSPSDANICSLMDNMVWMYHAPEIRGKDATSNLIYWAILVRSYFSLLFAGKVREFSKSLNKGSGKHERNSFEDARLSFYLTNFILFRLDTLVSDIINAVRADTQDHSIAYKKDISGAIAILYTGLMLVRKGLKNHLLKPIYGGEELSALLQDKVQEIMTDLDGYRGIHCDPDWAAHIDGALTHLRAAIPRTKVTLTLETQSRDMESPNTSSTSPSTLVSFSTPASSNDQQSSQNALINVTAFPPLYLAPNLFNSMSSPVLYPFALDPGPGAPNYILNASNTQQFTSDSTMRDSALFPTIPTGYSYPSMATAYSTGQIGVYPEPGAVNPISTPPTHQQSFTDAAMNENPFSPIAHTGSLFPSMTTNYSTGQVGFYPGPGAANQTSTSSTHQQSTTDAVMNDNPFSPIQPGEYTLDQMPSHASGSVNYYSEPGAGEMVFQNSGPSGHNKWINWSENYPHDTWRH